MRAALKKRSGPAWAVVLALIATSASANLLRNGTFQDDWLTLLPENQNHHWCYGTGFQNRRDYNPDGWFFSGSWDWMNADLPRGSRRLILKGPRAEARQRLNWVFVHDDRKREGFPDAGGFPAPALQRSRNPMSLVRDLTLRVRVRGDRVRPGAGSVEVALAPPGPIAADDPFGSLVPSTISVSAALPAGTFPFHWVEVRLRAAQWLKAAREAEAKNREPSALAATDGTALPGAISVAIRYLGADGEIEVERAELTASEPEAPNLLRFGDFETGDGQGQALAWSRPEKYRYFPPALYYVFNTWHNATAENRGFVVRDPLIPHAGRFSLKMVVPSGDEVQVSSIPIVLNQTEPRLIEVRAWVKTDQLNMLQIDALSETGERLDGFNFIHKAPVSIGTDDWREVRQVFRPRRPLRSLRLVLAARGVNGYTLGDTGETPQANATGTAWWDDVAVFEPESTPAELVARGVRIHSPGPATPAAPHLKDFDSGERLFGSNALTATIVNAGPPRTLSLVFRLTTADGRKSETSSPPRAFESGERVPVSVPYELPPGRLDPYTEHKGELTLVDEGGRKLAASELWFSTWSTPVDLELGALYLAPRQKQFVRINLGFSAETMKSIGSVRLDLIRRGSGAALRSITVPAGPADIAAQRERIPLELREDFTNLLLADLDAAELPLQPFPSPERRWMLRATVLDNDGRELYVRNSEPFCRQGLPAAQPGVNSVRLDTKNLLYVNDLPFFPWGAVYGHVPVFDGRTEGASGPFRDLGNLPPWSIYDGYTSSGYTRAAAGFNTDRFVAGAVTSRTQLEALWREDNRLAATAFITPAPVFSLAELAKGAGGEPAMNANLAFVKTAPMVVSVAAGIEEAFGLFQGVPKARLGGLQSVVESLRKAAGKPVMVGHGGYWNRFEFERVPFFDIYDPETEPLYPANLHTDLMPLIAGQEKTIWLRPQMYEDVPFERWRFHVYVELMRGARGFQIAHGPGDASLFRGLGGELEGLKSVLWSRDPGPEVRISPAMEHWVRGGEGRAYVIAATTHGLTLGRWRWQGGASGPHGRARITEGGTVVRDEANSYGIGEPDIAGPSLHGIQYLPRARRYPRGSRLVQWVWVDPAAPPRSLAILAKGDGRFTYAASWGNFDLVRFRSGPGLNWFLRSLYRHANGFLGFGNELLNSAIEYVPERTADQGSVPRASVWTRLEVDLSTIGLKDELIDGVAFIHDGGRLLWGRTTIESGSDADVLWGDGVSPRPEELARTRIEVRGLRAGARIKVLFEDREIVAQAGFFVDDFRGRDLYQRLGGGPGVGYGREPVALHIYEIP